MSHNGVVGSNLRKVQRFSVLWSEDATLVMHSNGLATRWNLEAYPGRYSRHPVLIAAVLYRDFLRGGDDVTVLVVRYRHQPDAGLKNVFK